MFSNEELKEMPVEVFYCDKKAHNKLSLYKSNCADTYFVFFAEGSSLYMMNHSADASDLGVMGLERIDMRTGESEWLWNENAGKMTTVVNCVMWNDHIYVDLGKGNGNDMVYWTEIYSRDKFEKIELPFLKGGYEILDELKIEDGYGYIVYRETEDSVEYFLITPEEVDKENPECNMLQLTR